MIDMFQNSLLDRATECLITLRAMSEHVEATGIVGEDGALAPCLRNSYVSFLNSFRLSMQAIYERSDKRPPKTPSLNDWIEAEEKKKDD